VIANLALQSEAKQYGVGWMGRISVRRAEERHCAVAISLIQIGSLARNDLAGPTEIMVEAGENFVRLHAGSKFMQAAAFFLRQ